jgi:F-type H+-transporting ATPase subunit b
MGWNWSTFGLEIINFVVLVWLLKRFFYRPVLAVLQARRADLAESLAQAQQARDEAQALQTRYAGRLAQWEEEKAAARATLAQQMAAERERALAQTQAALALERERSNAQMAQQQEAQLRELSQQARAHSLAFARTLLSRLAGAPLQARMLAVFLEDLAVLPQSQIDAQWGAASDQPAVRVSSAWALDAGQQEALRAALLARGMCAADRALDWQVLPELLCGLRLEVGACRLEFSLGGELDWWQQQRGADA